MRREDFPVRLCEISAISFAFADLLRGTKGLKGGPSVPFDLYCCSREAYEFYPVVLGNIHAENDKTSSTREELALLRNQLDNRYILDIHNPPLSHNNLDISINDLDLENDV